MPLGNVRWLGGLRGDSANSDGASEDAFVFAEHDFEPGERLDLGAEGRSSESFVPFFLVDDGRDQFYGGLMWSGAWRASLERADNRLRVAVSFPGVGTTVTPSRPFETPAHLLRRCRQGDRRRERRAASVRAAGHPPRTAASAARHLQHLVRVRHAHQRGRDGRGDRSRRGARRRALRHGRGLVRRRRARRATSISTPASDRGRSMRSAFPPGWRALPTTPTASG